jgi:hypothetical protein
MKYNDNVLIIGDRHTPFEHRDYLEFCIGVHKRFKCKRVIDIGDEVDNHAISYHEHDPDGMSAGHEYKLAKRRLAEWYKVFPKMEICIGNHTSLMFRKAYTYGIPAKMLKDYSKIWDTPNWLWVPEVNINGICIKHGNNISGQYGHINHALNSRKSLIMGHIHSVLDVYYMASDVDRIFACVVGCGIDRKAYAMAYGKDFARKPILGCAVLIEGKYPIPIPMEL